MQIGPVKYSKNEEKVFFKSILLGLLSGLPLGLVLTYIIGFPQYSHDLKNRFVYSFLLLGSVESISLLFSAILYLSYSKKAKLLHSWYDAARIVWALLVTFPILFIYIALVMSLLIFPLYDATFWLSPVKQYWLGALLFLPFLFLFMLIFLPDQKPRKIAANLWLIINRKAPIPKVNTWKAIVTLLILVWLVLTFLPLPSVLFVNMLLIAGWLLITVYLIKQRYRVRGK
jgi:hypothetical protein